MSTERPPCKHGVGDEVDLCDWDRSERPVNRMGFCMVVSIRRAQCQTGYMVKVRSLDRKDRAEMELDAAWLKRVSRVAT